MATLTKAQFKEHLKNPEVAHIKRNIHLLRKALKGYNWIITSHHDKRCKCFELKMASYVYDFKNYDFHGVEQHFNDVYAELRDIFKGCVYTTVTNSMCDIIEISLPYNRLKD